MKTGFTTTILHSDLESPIPYVSGSGEASGSEQIRRLM